MTTPISSIEAVKVLREAVASVNHSLRYCAVPNDLLAATLQTAFAATSHVEAPNVSVCTTCGGSKVDPGGLPVCRDCTAEPRAGDWIVRERRNSSGKLIDCFVESPAENDMPYALEVLGDDYTGYGDVERKLEHCKLIVSLVNASRKPVAWRRATKHLPLCDPHS
jgi:hypothetical protein